MMNCLKQHINNTDKSYQEDISIVMPVYNHADTLEEAIESALMQQMPYKSVLYCFDDASTDNSPEILSYYAEKNPHRIRVYTNPENLGKGKESYLHHRPPITGRYWCILAGDDYWTSREKLELQIAYLDENPDFAGCSCNSLMVNELSGEKSIIKPDRNSWNLYDLLLLKQKYAFYVHTTSIVWRNIYMDQGFFLPPKYQKKDIYGDVVMMHLMLARGGRLKNINKTMSCYRVTGRGIWTRNSQEEQAVLNKELNKTIKQIVPIKYKIFSHLHYLRKHSKFLRTILPGTIND